MFRLFLIWCDISEFITPTFIGPNQFRSRKFVGYKLRPTYFICVFQSHDRRFALRVIGWFRDQTIK